MNKEFQIQEEALYEAASLLGKTFIQRSDMFPSQLADGRYISIKEPLSERHLRLHLEGRITLGAYMLACDSTTHLMAFDADGEDDIVTLADLAKDLKEIGVPTYLETSRRGGHLWFFFEKAQEGEKVRMFGKALMEFKHLKDVELYPKQDRLKGGPGSLVRLPFGVHRISGKRYPFILPAGEILALTVMEQIHILSAPQTVPEHIFAACVDYVASKPKPQGFKANGEIYASSKIEAIKQAVPIIDFIGNYVELKPIASGAVGRCPFHADNRPSFGVNKEGNYWHCFAGCGGGSIIDFWMKWKNIGFSQAVDELAELLGMR